MFNFFNSWMFNFELTRLLGSTSASGCETGEFLTAVGKIKQHDAQSWHDAWKEQGERAEKIADEAASKGLKPPARNAYLRASNYFRAASYLFFNKDPRVVPLSERSIKNFERAASLMDGEVLLINIPYENGLSLPGYLYLPPEHARLPGKTPVLMYLGGADSTKEELHFLFGDTGPGLGYAVLCFEGPGQGLLLKKHKLPLRPDFEVCSALALDFIENLSASRPELQLDLDRIAVAGAVTGGYYALRTSTDPRIKACVSIDPFFSMWELATSRVPKVFFDLWESGWITDWFIDWSTMFHANNSFPAGWETHMGMAGMGVETPSAMLKRMKVFSLENDKDGKMLERVTCPVLLTGPGSGREVYSSAVDGALKVYNRLSQIPEGNKETWIPEEEADGGLTAKIGAWPLLAQKSFQFLDKHLDVKRPEL
ncbi:alpha/beta-hydrolase [Trichoderma chlorosporum]